MFSALRVVKASRHWPHDCVSVRSRTEPVHKLSDITGALENSHCLLKHLVILQNFKHAFIAKNLAIIVFHMQTH